MSSISPIRVFIVDDHQLIVDGIQSLLEDLPNIIISSSTTKSADVVSLLNSYPSDILISDVNMPEISGVELTRLVKKKFPKIKIIALSMFGESAVITEMIRAGISGYVLKNTDRQELVSAIEQVHDGRTYFSADITTEMMKAISVDKNVSKLTNREIEIIRLIEKEFSNRQIADSLFISERTVETHRKNIFRKTNTQSVVGLIKHAYQYKII